MRFRALLSQSWILPGFAAFGLSALLAGSGLAQEEPPRERPRAPEARERAEQLEQIQERFREMREQAERRAREAMEQAERRAQEARQQAEMTAQQLEERARQNEEVNRALNELRARFEELEQRSQQQFRELEERLNRQLEDGEKRFGDLQRELMERAPSADAIRARLGRALGPQGPQFFPGGPQQGPGRQGVQGAPGRRPGQAQPGSGPGPDRPRPEGEARPEEPGPDHFDRRLDAIESKLDRLMEQLSAPRGDRPRG